MTDPVVPSVGIQLLEHPAGDPGRSVAEAFGDHYRRALSGDPARLRGESAGAVGRPSGDDTAPERRDNVLKNRDGSAVDRPGPDRARATTGHDRGPERARSVRGEKDRKAERADSSNRASAAGTEHRETDPTVAEANGSVVTTPVGDDVSSAGEAAGAQIVVAAAEPVTVTGEDQAGVGPVEGTAGPTAVEISGEVAVQGALVDGKPADGATTDTAVGPAGTGNPAAIPVAGSSPVGEATAAPVEEVAPEQATSALAGSNAVPVGGIHSQETAATPSKAAGTDGTPSGAVPGDSTPATPVAGSSPVAAAPLAASDPSAVTVAETVVVAAGITPADSGAAAPAGAPTTGSVSGIGQTAGGGEAGAVSPNPTGTGLPSAATSRGPTGPEAGSLQRVVESIEAMTRQNPPRSVTLDFGSMHGLRVRLAVHATGVQVTVTDAGAGANRVEMWEQQLSDLLGERGLGAGDRGQTPGGGDREPSRPWARPDTGAPSAARRVRATRNNEIRL